MTYCSETVTVFRQRRELNLIKAGSNHIFLPGWHSSLASFFFFLWNEKENLTQIHEQFPGNWTLPEHVTKLQSFLKCFLLSCCKKFNRNRTAVLPWGKLRTAAYFWRAGRRIFCHWGNIKYLSSGCIFYSKGWWSRSWCISFPPTALHCCVSCGFGATE